jgi:hypothetical protein
MADEIGEIERRLASTLPRPMTEKRGTRLRYLALPGTTLALASFFVVIGSFYFLQRTEMLREEFQPFVPAGLLAVGSVFASIITVLSTTRRPTPFLGRVWTLLMIPVSLLACLMLVLPFVPRGQAAAAATAVALGTMVLAMRHLPLSPESWKLHWITPASFVVTLGIVPCLLFAQPDPLGPLNDKVDALLTRIAEVQQSVDLAAEQDWSVFGSMSTEEAAVKLSSMERMAATIDEGIFPDPETDEAVELWRAVDLAARSDDVQQAYASLVESVAALNTQDQRPRLSQIVQPVQEGVTPTQWYVNPKVSQLDDAAIGYHRLAWRSLAALSPSGKVLSGSTLQAMEAAFGTTRAKTQDTIRDSLATAYMDGRIYQTIGDGPVALHPENPQRLLEYPMIGGISPSNLPALFSLSWVQAMELAEQSPGCHYSEVATDGFVSVECFHLDFDAQGEGRAVPSLLTRIQWVTDAYGNVEPTINDITFLVIAPPGTSSYTARSAFMTAFPAAVQATVGARIRHRRTDARQDFSKFLEFNLDSHESEHDSQWYTIQLAKRNPYANLQHQKGGDGPRQDLVQLTLKTWQSTI